MSRHAQGPVTSLGQPREMIREDCVPVFVAKGLTVYRSHCGQHMASPGALLPASMSTLGVRLRGVLSVVPSGEQPVGVGGSEKVASGSRSYALPANAADSILEYLDSAVAEATTAGAMLHDCVLPCASMSLDGGLPTDSVKVFRRLHGFPPHHTCADTSKTCMPAGRRPQYFDRKCV